MALADLQIDDRTYDQLLATLRKGLPADYTDHNLSDPAMAVLELQAWLGEMALYRMDRMPAIHQDRFLDLLLDPPEPVTVAVKFTVAFAGAPYSISIPAGTRVATDFNQGRRVVFETLRPTVLTATRPSAQALAREFLEVTDELLGLASGSPAQTLSLAPVRSRLGLPADALVPVLADYSRRSPTYDPNPQVRVFRGTLSSVSGATGLVSVLAGIVQVDFGSGIREATYGLSYIAATRTLTLTRSDGVSHSTPVPPGALGPGQTETIALPGFGARLTLGAGFDKSADLTPGAPQAVVTGGTGAIDPTSLSILETSGSVAGLTSSRLTLGPFAAFSEIPVVLGTGYSGVLDASSSGAQRLELRDAEGNRITLGLFLTTQFNGSETAATLVVPALAHLVAHSAEKWTVQHSLLTNRTGPSSRHVRLDPLRGTLQFGDGTHGAIPPPGASVLCRRYQVLGGPVSRIEATAIHHILSPIPDLGVGDQLTATNEVAALGGRYFHAPERRLVEGLQAFRTPYRLVTDADFERVLLEDFNDYQSLGPTATPVARVEALMNQAPSLTSLTPSSGHVTLLVLLAGLAPLPPVADRILQFLEDRRLITTRLHLIEPAFLPIQLALRFVPETKRNAAELKQQVRDALSTYLDPLLGGADQRGWPLGRSIFQSEILRLVEALPGVDHVDSLSLSPADANGNVPLATNQLPRITSPSALQVFALRS